MTISLVTPCLQKSPKCSRAVCEMRPPSTYIAYMNQAGRGPKLVHTNSHSSGASTNAFHDSLVSCALWCLGNKSRKVPNAPHSPPKLSYVLITVFEGKRKKYRSRNTTIWPNGGTYIYTDGRTQPRLVGTTRRSVERSTSRNTPLHFCPEAV